VADGVVHAIQDLNDAIEELRAVGNRSAHTVCARILQTLEEPPLSSVVSPQVSAFDFDEWWGKGLATFRAQPGSATLDWPREPGPRVAARIGVLRIAAAKERGFLEFAYPYIGMQGNFDDRLRDFIRMVVQPLVQEVTRLAERQSSMPSLRPVPAPPVVRAFLSYSTVDRHRAADIKKALAEFGIECFMAHDDIGVSEEWRNRIILELKRMNVFVPILSANFTESKWTSQEVGFAISREDVVVCVPVALDDTIPYGFLSPYQGKPLPNPVDADFFTPALGARVPRVVVSRLIQELAASRSFRSAERNFEALVPYFDRLTTDEAGAIATAATTNNQIWDAADCRTTHIPRFLAENRHHLPPAMVSQLEAFVIQQDE
jgi:hypothetical protein